ncbi:MAG: hypothetical protein HY858_14660 [Candidatus Solibacter usitatus]|nr:hypothetical protein [Candidatus Solibacter usitatus]
MVRLLIACLVALPVLAQEAAKPAQPADSKAFMAAVALKEADKKLAALDQFIEDFPSSNRVEPARREIIAAAVKLKPADAVTRTRAMAKGLSSSSAAELHRFLAVELLDANQLLKEAERSAKTALKRLAEEDSAARARKDAEELKRPAPTEAQVRSRFASQRAQMQETLGRVLLARGNNGQAKKVFTAALRDNPTLSTAAMSLGDIQSKAGKPKEALNYYAQGMLARPSPESRARFSEAWKKVHGSVQGEPEFLDERYKAIFPNPLHATPYQKTAARSGRLVLAEVYTGAGCGPCVAADLAFEAALERYGRAELAVVMYHEHIPRPDPMSNADTVARWKFQAGRGVPTYAIDGIAPPGGGGPREYAGEVESRIRPMIEKGLETAPGASLTLSAANDGREVVARAGVSNVTKPSPDLVLHIALVEKELRYSGENGIRFHPMVVRSLSSFPLGEAKEKSETQTFNLAAVAAALNQHLVDFEKHDERHNKDGKFRFMEHLSSIDAADLAVVALVQDAKSKAILQAAWADAPRR